MSELEKTAPNEIYLIVGDADKDCKFNELAEVTWADKPIYEETAIKYIKSYQLTIPKNIADEVVTEGIDAYVIQTSLPSNSYLIPEWEPLVDLSDNLIKWSETTEKWWAILDAYLAGKALGVDLVKVVEG